VFLRKINCKKSGKNHQYWALMESYRTPKGPRNRVVSYLGELSRAEQKQWAGFAESLNGRSPAAPGPTLFEPEPEGEPVPENVRVHLPGVRVEEARRFGDVWLGLALWRALCLDELMQQLFPPGREDVRWDLMAAILALARLCEPSSELQIEQHWYRSTALPELLGIVPEKVHAGRLYRTLDRLAPHKDAIEQHLRRRLGTLFELDYELLLYDVTSTYFEGKAERNPQARRGYSRDSRPDCKQICIGLIVTTDGLPLGYEVFDGNRTDVTTVEEIVETMEARHGRASRIWVMDRGMVSEENLEFLRRRGGRYIVGTPRSQLKAFERELTEQGWESVYESVEVKLCGSPDGEETFVLCRSGERGEKEKAMRERFTARMDEALARLRRRLENAKRRPGRTQVERQIGRMLSRNSRVAGQYDIRVEDDPARPGHLTVSWTRREDRADWAALSDGAYLLRTNLTGMGPREFWKMYIQLTDAEAAFRTLKSDLRIRPVYHQVPRRVHAHILVAFLAYVMHKTLQKWMEGAQLGRGVRVVMQEVAKLQYCRITLPTDQSRAVELRCVSRPDKHLEVLLGHLGLRVPARLGRPTWCKTLKVET
jgi:transposase